MSLRKRVTELVEGDMIDMEPIAAAEFGSSGIPTSMAWCEFEYATVLGIEIVDDQVLVDFDGGGWTFPIDAEIDVE